MGPASMIALFLWIALRTIGFWFPFHTVLFEVMCILIVVGTAYGVGRKAGIKEATNAMSLRLNAFTDGIKAAFNESEGEDEDNGKNA